MGALAEKTLDGIRADVATTLQQFGFHSTHTEKIVKTCVPEASPGLAAPVCDLDILFRELKEMDIKIALCTADSRRATEEQMQILGIEHMLDDVVCGNDKGIIPKPSPHCAIQICKRLGVELDEAVMVGDTIADLKMGRVAGLRASVAVLSGVGTRETLSEYTDYYLDDASTLPSLIRDEIHQDFYNKRG
ncbi:hypothetical protein WR25_06692 [Diploscapter pachys]|nr:hypothetical protein WR25_06692 [Diploscapter pachys]